MGKFTSINMSGAAKLAAMYAMVAGPMATYEAYRENQLRDRLRQESVSAPGQVIGGAKSSFGRSDHHWLKFQFVSADGKSREARCEVTPAVFNAHMRDGTVTQAETKVYYLAHDPSGALLEMPRGAARNIWTGVFLFIGGAGLLTALLAYDLRRKHLGPVPD